MSTSASPFAQAIAIAEGYGTAGAVPTTANNPGDLEVGDVGYGTTSGGITIFGTAEEGWQALENQVTKMTSGGSNVYNPSMSISQAGSIYSGGDPNWSTNVSNSLGVDASTPLSALGNGVSSSGNASSVTSPSTLSSLGNGILSSMGPVGSAIGAAINPSASSSAIARILVVIVGLILIAAGLFAFKTTQTVIQIGTKAAKKGAELAAA